MALQDSSRESSYTDAEGVQARMSTSTASRDRDRGDYDTDDTMAQVTHMKAGMRFVVQNRCCLTAG